MQHAWVRRQSRTKFLSENQGRGDHFADLGVDGESVYRILYTVSGN